MLLKKDGLLYRLAFFTLIGGLFWGCGSTEDVVEKQQTPATEEQSMRRTVTVPAGVDSASAYQADSLADESFVSPEKQEEAEDVRHQGEQYVSVSDTLWEYLEVSTDTTVELEEEKEVAAVRSYNRGAEAFKEYQQVTEAGELEGEELENMQEQLLEEAQKAFEESIRINPYDEAARSALARVYTLRADRLGSEDAYEEAIEILERLTRLRKDVPGLFAALANNYYQTEQWRKAAENYDRAQEVYEESVELALEEDVEYDSTQVYNYLTAEADAHVYARDASEARETYENAMQLAVTEDQRKFVEEEVEWIEWDDGNIDASFARDSLRTLASQGDYDGAASGFRSLLQEVETREATDEVEWRLAQAEFQNGKEDQAANRLQELFERTEKREDGTPVDSTYQRYFDTYGVICYNLGQQYRNDERDLRTALQYFEQSTRVSWERRGLAALEAGELLNNNVDESIEYLELAHEHQEALNSEDRRDLYRLLVNQHRRQGNQEEALQYRNLYREMSTETDTTAQ